MDIVQLITDRLQPLGVPIRELGDPLPGRQPGQPGGITAFLAQHPEGYVEIDQPQGISAVDTDTYWVIVSAVGPSRAAAAALAAQVRALLCGDQQDDPREFAPVIPAQPERTAPDIYVCAVSYETTTL